jgi:hypothetical protein
VIIGLLFSIYLGIKIAAKSDIMQSEYACEDPCVLEPHLVDCLLHLLIFEVIFNNCEGKYVKPVPAYL